MTRNEFIEKVGKGASLLFLASCAGALHSCSDKDVVAPQNVDFTIDISTGALASNGGYLVKNGVIVARTSTGNFLAVSASCTHQGSTINYNSSSNQFVCPSHGSKFNATGGVANGPASSSLKQYNTTLNGTSLRVFS